MIERRQHKRVPVGLWISQTHPLLGVVTGNVRDISAGGMAVTLDENVGFFTMMELQARIHGDGWDRSIPPLTVQVVWVNEQEIGLRFTDKEASAYVQAMMSEKRNFDFTDAYLRSQPEINAPCKSN